MDLPAISQQLAARCDAVAAAVGPPVDTVYNPLRYAWEPHVAYLERYGVGTKRFLWLGMNPGPFGMGQTGVPFGDVPSVRDWLGVEAPVHTPDKFHPKRPVQGFAFTRREGSGKRLWGWAAERFGTPDRFFAQQFVHNYCPLFFVHETGRNITPDKLRVEERAALTQACDAALVEVAAALQVHTVIAVGAYAEQRALEALAGQSAPPDVIRILHPSPASPAANRGWAEQVEPALEAAGALRDAL